MVVISTPSANHGVRGRIVDPGEQAQQSALSAAGAAEETDDRPRRNGRRQPREDGVLRFVGVGKRQIPDLDGRSVTGLHHPSRAALRTLDRRVHELEDAFEGRPAALNHRHHPTHRSQRREEDRKQGGEGRQLADGQGAGQNHRSADGDQREHRHTARQNQQRQRGRTDDGQPHAGPQPLAVPRFEPLDECLLGDEALDGRHALEAAEHVLGNFAELLLAAPREVEEASDRPLDETGTDDHRQQHHQCQTRRQRHHLPTGEGHRHGHVEESADRRSRPGCGPRRCRWRHG